MKLRSYLAIAAGLLALQVAILLALGHPPICACGSVELWYASPSGPGTSQHLADWYSFTHVLHGIWFYLLLWLVAPRSPVLLRFVLAIGIEVGWEVIENMPVIIDRYRQTALAQGYFGDSIVNSVADTLAAALGFVLARAVPVWTSAAIVIGTELFLAWMIRDNLALNVIQLVFPFEAISRWQTGG